MPQPNVAQSPLPTVTAGGKQVALSSAGFKDACEWVDRFPLLGSLSGVFQNPSYLDFEMREPNVTFVDQLILEMEIANANVAAATLINALFLWTALSCTLAVGSSPPITLKTIGT